MKHLTKLKRTNKFRRVKHYQSFTLKQADWSLNELEGRIRIGKKWYGYFKSRNIEGKVKTVTVKRDAVGDIYIYLSCEIQNKPIEPRTGKSVGFDFGLKTFLTGSDGYNVNSPYFFMQNAKRIRERYRKLSHKQKGSNNLERARKDLASAYRKMENRRRDFHFKTVRNLCREYALICLEDLNMKGMAHRYGREVHSLVLTDRFYPSSQLCSVCGYKKPTVKDLHIREWDCPSCWTHHGRDENAAKNILMAGASAIKSMSSSQMIFFSGGLCMTLICARRC